MSLPPRPCPRESGPAPPTRRALSGQAEASSAQCRSAPIGLAQACLAGWVGSSPGDRSTGDGGRLASQGLALVLDLEVADSTRSTSPKPGGPRVDRSNVAGEPTVGHRADPWGTTEARNRGQQSIDTPLSMARPEAGANSKLANVPAQSDQRHLGGRPVRGPNDRHANLVRVLLYKPPA